MTEQTEKASKQRFQLPFTANILTFQYIMQGFAKEICWTQYLSDSKLEWMLLTF